MQDFRLRYNEFCSLYSDLVEKSRSLLGSPRTGEGRPPAGTPGREPGGVYQTGEGAPEGVTRTIYLEAHGNAMSPLERNDISMRP